MVLTLHHLNQSQSQRVLWLLEELEIPYELKLYTRDEATKRAPPELTKIHPLGKSPVIEDGDLVLAESGAIINYIISTYGKGRFVAKTPKERALDEYWNQFANATAQTWLMTAMTFKFIPNFVPPEIKDSVESVGPVLKRIEDAFINPEVTKCIKYLSEELSKSSNGWIVNGDAEGNPTGADFQLSWIPAFLPLICEVPKPLKAYTEKIHARPAWKRAIDKGGPFDMTAFLR